MEKSDLKEGTDKKKECHGGSESDSESDSDESDSEDEDEPQTRRKYDKGNPRDWKSLLDPMVGKAPSPSMGESNSAATTTSRQCSGRWRARS